MARDVQTSLPLTEATFFIMLILSDGAKHGYASSLLGIWASNLVMLLVANGAWEAWNASQGKPSPLVPVLMLLKITLAAGPIMGLFTRPIIDAIWHG
jgi:hypothetical protein